MASASVAAGAGAWLLNQGHGLRRVRLTTLGAADGTPLRVSCLDSNGQPTDATVSDTALVEGGIKLYFFLRQDGLCTVFQDELRSGSTLGSYNSTGIRGRSHCAPCTSPGKTRKRPPFGYI